MNYCNSSDTHSTVFETETEALAYVDGYHGIVNKLKAMQLTSLEMSK